MKRCMFGDRDGCAKDIVVQSMSTNMSTHLYKHPNQRNITPARCAKKQTHRVAGERNFICARKQRSSFFAGYCNVVIAWLVSHDHPKEGIVRMRKRGRSSSGSRTATALPALANSCDGTPAVIFNLLASLW